MSGTDREPPAMLRVEAVFARPDRQLLVELDVAQGATVEDVLEASGLYAEFPRDGLRTLETGVWGKPVPRQTVVCDGDRVELYRPLAADPREARRQRAGGNSQER